MTLTPRGAKLSPGNSDLPFGDRSALKRAVGDWCLRNASRCLQSEAVEEAAQWDLLAAHTLDLNCNPLTSPELERQLIEIARRLPLPSSHPVIREAGSERWLHVLNEAYSFGGHTAMVYRWIRSDPRPNQHSIILLSQRNAVPPALTEATQSTGGSILQLDPHAPLLTQAVQLRSQAWNEADVVVLHIHPWDVVSTLAFGIPGGPPVLFVNHAAHIFWVGASVADVVLNLRVSTQEDEWTRSHRGVDRYMHLPIPLPEPMEQLGECAIAPEARREARETLGLPDHAPILLTVGTGYKYTPVPSLDFLETAVAILQACADAYFMAVGVTEDSRWEAAREVTGGRLRALGCRPAHKVATYQAAADMYLEGFPFGSTTALLEAGIRGLPCVLSPKTCPPPFASDGIALAVTDRPEDAKEYIVRAITLVKDPHERKRLGSELAASIRAHHTGPGWARYLNKIQDGRPIDHRVWAPSNPPPVPDPLASFWGNFCTVAWKDDPLGTVFRLAIQRGLRPRTDAQVVRAARMARRGRGISAPSEALLHLTRGLISHLPLEAALLLYDRLLLFRHDGRLMRLFRTMRMKVAKLPQRRYKTSHKAGGNRSSEPSIGGVHKRPRLRTRDSSSES
jgi:glycosyltransferase involved in cell wall biosynthesis